MQLFILILVALNLYPAQQNADVVSSTDNDIVVEIMNPEKISFQFSVKYEARRKMIKIRSEQPIKSLRTVDTETNKHKGYNVAGSELIFLPKSGFSVGTHIAEFKFEKSDVTVMAKIHVTEEALANG
ncbi:hypothetical protein N9176_01405 [bacterium]|nr:hypothetical protein [bacterium]